MHLNALKCLYENIFSGGLYFDSLDIFVTFHDSRSFKNSFVRINNEYLDFHQHFDVIEYTNYSPAESVNFINVIIAKSIGIIRVIESDEEWIIVNDSSRIIEVAVVKTIIEDC